LVGPDGAGKTAIGRRLERTFPLRVKYVYMGNNLDSSNLMLPTTRLLAWIKLVRGGKPDVAGPPDPKQSKRPPESVVRRSAARLKASLYLANWIAEEWFRQQLAWYYQRRGNIVLFDRHFFADYYAHDIAASDRARPLSSRVHGFMLERIYPKPDLMILLDAPAEVLLARKAEGTLEALARRREEYPPMRGLVRHFAIVDASQPEDDVARAVADVIWDFYNARTANTSRVHGGHGESE